MTFAGLMTLSAAAGVAVVFGLWLRTVARRYWVRGSGCRGCAYRDAGPCTCERISPVCKGGAKR